MYKRKVDESWKEYFPAALFEFKNGSNIKPNNRAETAFSTQYLRWILNDCRSLYTKMTKYFSLRIHHIHLGHVVNPASTCIPYPSQSPTQKLSFLGAFGKRDGWRIFTRFSYYASFILLLSHCTMFTWNECISDLYVSSNIPPKH